VSTPVDRLGTRLRSVARASKSLGRRAIGRRRTHHFVARDGLDLAYVDIGSGRPLVLLHGFLASGRQWLDHGPAVALVRSGYRVILPDLRGHGDSSRPHDAASYPLDVLTDDGLALIEHLGLDEFDLGGYSLGAKIAVQIMARGAVPGRAVVAGQGLEAMTNGAPRGRYRRVLTALVNGDTIEPSTPDAETASWITRLGGDPQALLAVLNSLVPTPPDELRRISLPTLVVVGEDDRTHSSADVLASMLPCAEFCRVPGNHWTALTGTEFRSATVGFLTRSLTTPSS
jgi:pimeloyl-ACP methyl ester carboxylesterase